MSNPAPGTLETVRAFVNTLDIDDGIELLTGPAELAKWLADADLTGGQGARELGATRASERPANRVNVDGCNMRAP